jgi:hypothetical protein
MFQQSSRQVGRSPRLALSRRSLLSVYDLRKGLSSGNTMAREYYLRQHPVPETGYGEPSAPRNHSGKPSLLVRAQPSNDNSSMRYL